MDPAKIHILVLDRGLEAARAICRILKQAGYQVWAVSNESEALSLAEGKLFNLVVKSFDEDLPELIASVESPR